MPQFLVEPSDVDPGAGRARIRGDEARHLARVLRLAPGARVALCDGRGGRWEGRLVAAGPPAEVADLEPLPPNEPPLEVEILQALIKGERWEWVLEKGTELGVSRFRPVYARRSVARIPGPKIAARTERWRRVAAAAVKQCERGRVPRVDPPVDLAGAIEALGTPGPGEARIVWAERLPGAPGADGPAAPGRVILAVGPEGGWDPGDRELLEAAGFVARPLGPRVLRAETAAVAGVVWAMARWGDLERGAPGW